MRGVGLSSDDFHAALSAACGAQPATTAPQHFALAVSGGGDSMGLLALAAQLSQSSGASPNKVMGKAAPRFSVLSVDHGLRASAAAEIDAVAAACAKLGLAHHRLVADTVLGPQDVQQQARRLRYRLMAEWCAANGATALITAHHAQDQAETVLMRLARGSGIDGLSGMARRQTIETEAGGLTILRPLLSCQPQALHQAAAACGLPIAYDPSNEDARFERVRWRRALPRLADCGLDVAALGRLADDMRAIRRTLDGAVLQWLEAHADWHEYGVLVLPRNAYGALSTDMQRRLMRAFVGHFAGRPHPPKRQALARFAARPLSAKTGSATLAGVRMHWRRDMIFLGREAAATPRKALSQSGDNTTQLFDNRFIVEAATKTPHGLYVVGLGVDGVKQLRDAGAVFDKTVPACYHAGLVGIFDAEALLSCPIVQAGTDFSARSVYSSDLFRDIMSHGQDW